MSYFETGDIGEYAIQANVKRRTGLRGLGLIAVGPSAVIRSIATMPTGTRPIHEPVRGGLGACCSGCASGKSRCAGGSPLGAVVSASFVHQVTPGTPFVPPPPVPGGGLPPPGGVFIPPPIVDTGMSTTVKLLLLAGVAGGGFLLYRRFKGKPSAPTSNR